MVSKQHLGPSFFLSSPVRVNLSESAFCNTSHLQLSLGHALLMFIIFLLSYLSLICPIFFQYSSALHHLLSSWQSCLSCLLFTSSSPILSASVLSIFYLLFYPLSSICLY